VSGQPVTFTNWREGEPSNNDFIPAGEDYGYLFQPGFDDRGVWNDFVPFDLPPIPGEQPAPQIGAVVEVVPLPPAVWPGAATLGGLLLHRVLPALRGSVRRR
jgi:hypothetical protein